MPLAMSARVFLRACRQWSANQDSRLGAALAYYTLFSIAPLLVIAIHIAAFIFGEDAARGKVVEQLSDTFGKESAQAIQNLINNAAQPKAGALATLVSVVVLIIGALSVFLNLRSALRIIWKLELAGGNTILGIILDYFLALVMVLCTGVLLLVSLAASMIVPILRSYLERQFPAIGFQWQILEFGISLLFLTLLFGAIFYVLSGRRISCKYVFYGAVVTALLFTIGKLLVGLYLVYTGTASTYGAAGALVVFLVWVYYSSQILFFGAEMVQARRTRHEWLN